jgi:hypothetical protein
MRVVQIENTFYNIWTGLTQLKGYLEMVNIVVVMGCLHMLGLQGYKNPQCSIVDAKNEVYPSVRQMAFQISDAKLHK